MSFYDELKRRNVLRVAIAYLAASWLLIQVLETLFPIFGLAETSVRIIVIALGILFIPAVIVAWVFEVTPEGIQKDADARKAARGILADRTAIDNVIIITLTLALGYFAVDKFILDPARDAAEVEAAAEKAATDALVGSYGDNSIVVLPFVNMSNDPDQEYFSDGIAEELLNLLAKVGELRVISRSSAFAFKGQDIEIPEIAKRLNVANVLEGSVRKAGNRVRITVQLIDARTDTHIWSESYDRELDDVFAIQDEISAHVVEQLKITILGDLPHAKQIDPEAYSLYLRARHIVHGGQWDKLELAEQLLNDALAIEPDYVPALDMLGLAYFNFTQDTHPSNENFWRLIGNLSARVSAAEPGGVSELRWRAWIAYRHDYDLTEAARLFERALALEPGDLATLSMVTNFLRVIGYLEEAFITAEYVALRDPACVLCLAMVSRMSRATGQYDRAIEMLQNAVDWAPDRHHIYWSLGSVLLQAGRPEDALAVFEKDQDRSQREFGRIMALHDLGRMKEFEELFAEKQSDEPDNAEGHARIYAWTGNNDLALEWLEKFVVQQGPNELRDLASGGFYRNLESDPRFDALLRKHGQHPDQQEKIPFKFTPPE